MKRSGLLSVRLTALHGQNLSVLALSIPSVGLATLLLQVSLDLIP